MQLGVQTQAWQQQGVWEELAGPFICLAVSLVFAELLGLGLCGKKWPGILITLSCWMQGLVAAVNWYTTVENLVFFLNSHVKSSSFLPCIPPGWNIRTTNETHVTICKYLLIGSYALSSVPLNLSKDSGEVIFLNLNACILLPWCLPNKNT